MSVRKPGVSVAPTQLGGGARGMTKVIDNYPHQMGGHCGSGAWRDLLHWAGLGWGGPPTEGLVFALGGAVDLAYLRSSALDPPVYLVGPGGGSSPELEHHLAQALDYAAQHLASSTWRRGR